MSEGTSTAMTMLKDMQQIGVYATQLYPVILATDRQEGKSRHIGEATEE